MRDVEKQCVMAARRDTGAKDTIPWADVAARVPALLEQIQVRRMRRPDVHCFAELLGINVSVCIFLRLSADCNSHHNHQRDGGMHSLDIMLMKGRVRNSAASPSLPQLPSCPAPVHPAHAGMAAVWV